MYGHGFHPSALRTWFVHLAVVHECHLWVIVRRLNITDDFSSNRQSTYRLQPEEIVLTGEETYTASRLHHEHK